MNQGAFRESTLGTTMLRGLWQREMNIELKAGKREQPLLAQLPAECTSVYILT